MLHKVFYADIKEMTAHINKITDMPKACWKKKISMI